MADATNSSSSPTPKPLSQKTEAELKRETKARLRRLDPATANELLSEVMESPVGTPVVGFVNFLREHAIVGLAVGFVFGTQVQAVVKQFISSFVDPLLGLLIPTGTATNGQKAKGLSDLTFAVHFNGHYQDFAWGAFAYVLLDFVFVAVIIYILVRVFSLEKLDKKK